MIQQNQEQNQEPVGWIKPQHAALKRLHWILHHRASDERSLVFILFPFEQIQELNDSIVCV